MTGEPMEVIADRLAAECRALEEAASAVTYPTPEHSSRDPWPVDFVAPGPVAQLRMLAERAGWDVTMTYSRGHYPHGTTGQPTALRHTVAVRVVHQEAGYGGYAIYASPVAKPGWTWLSVMLWGRDLPPFHLASITDMKAWIQAGGRVSPRWYTTIRDRERAKVMAKANRPVGSGRKKGPMS